MVNYKFLRISKRFRKEREETSEEEEDDDEINCSDEADDGGSTPDSSHDGFMFTSNITHFFPRAVLSCSLRRALLLNAAQSVHVCPCIDPLQRAVPLPHKSTPTFSPGYDDSLSLTSS